MKPTILLALFLSFACLESQAQYPQSQNVNLLYHAFDSTLELNYRDSRYSEIWGFTQGDRDYAVIACTYGHYFYDITDPENTYLADSVAGVIQGFGSNWRDYHDYNGYLYAVDDSGPSGLQIMDISDLPNSVSLVYESDTLFSKAHNVFIDTSAAVLYLCGSDIGHLAVFSLTDPVKPVLIDVYDEWNYIHDIYVRNGIAYLESAYIKTMYAVDFTDPANPINLGSLADYPDAGVTHSGWLSEDGQTYVLLDETYYAGIKTVDVSDLTDMTVLDIFSVNVDSSMAHNVIVKENYAYVSYYNNGFQLFDISDPSNAERYAWYDTYDGGKNGDFRGAWGVYVFPDKNKVIISDRQSGLYVLEVIFPAVDIENVEAFSWQISPNPVDDYFQIESNSLIEEVRLIDLSGRVFFLENDEDVYEVSHLPAGSYIFRAKIEGHDVAEKVILLD